MKFYLVIVAVSAVLGSLNADDIDDKVINGIDTHIANHPYIVSMQAVLPDGRRFRYCGGSIIGKQWVLTAAHCIMGPDFPGKVHVQAGSMMSQCGDNVHGQFIPVAKQIPHPEYVGAFRQVHDIALLHLERPLQYNSNVQPIRMARANEYFGDQGLVLGWGSRNNQEMNNGSIGFQCVSLQETRTQAASTQACSDTMEIVMQDFIRDIFQGYEQQTQQLIQQSKTIQALYEIIVNHCPTALQQVQKENITFLESVRNQTERSALRSLPPFHNHRSFGDEMIQYSIGLNPHDTRAASAWEPFYETHKVDSKRQICLGTPANMNNGCKGDSGGPYVQRDTNGIETLVGLTSYGHPTDCEKTPGVYTKVSYYSDWIRRETGILSG